MKTIRYYILSIALAFVVVGCAEDEFDVNHNLAKPGDEVQFGVTLPNANTRTVYGPELNNAFPIYWVDGDKVMVTSPQCAISKSEYKVTANTTSQNYANSLTKTGEAGIQWGTSDANFYSVYPSANTTADGSNVFTITMPHNQEIGVSVSDDGVHSSAPDMNACFMTAATLNVPNGTTVNLKYKPLSTAIRFTLTGPTFSNKSENLQTVTIDRIRLVAPEGTAISGEFTLTINEEDGTTSVHPIENETYNFIELLPSTATGAYPTLSCSSGSDGKGVSETVEVNAFIMLGTETQITNDWYIEVKVKEQATTDTGAAGDGTTFKKSLGLKDESKNKLVPGQIHRLPAMPNLNIANNRAHDIDEWMNYIPRNVYLSEISVPGSWNSLNEDAQGKREVTLSDGNYANSNTIEAQYAKGCRAFHLDTRWGRSGSFLNYTYDELSVADGGSTAKHPDGGKVMLNSSTFKSRLKSITDYYQGKTDIEEFMVVFCSFAHDSWVNPDMSWMEAVINACADNDIVIDASNLTPDTTIRDVAGKVLVIILADHNTTYPIGDGSGKCLFLDAPMTLDDAADAEAENSRIYNAAGNMSNVYMYNTYAQVERIGNYDNPYERGYAPSESERHAAIKTIMDWSKDNYVNRAEDYTHNSWPYIGIGGYRIESTRDWLNREIWESKDDQLSYIAPTYNAWFKTTYLDPMPASGYYPVGIILMNDICATEGTALAKAIVDLNDKYRQAYDPSIDPDTGDTIGGGQSLSAAKGYGAGLSDSGADVWDVE